MSQPQCPPVLLIIFNRPALAQRVFERIRDARPKQLFVAADGPRGDHPNDMILCEAARALTENVDWDCQINKLYRTENVGCKIAPHHAISWFFENVDSGIILEDDCLPQPSFFRFCGELLEKYKDDNRVFMVSGRNDLGAWNANHFSYSFTLGNTWGWATWKRAWRYCDIDLITWTEQAAQENMQKFAKHLPWLAEDIVCGCRAVLERGLDAWDYQWAFVRIANDGVGVIPNVNLVANIGFGAEATHTFSSDSLYASVPVYEMQFPLRHNSDMNIDYAYYAECHRSLFNIKSSRVKLLLKNCLAAIKKKINRS